MCWPSQRHKAAYAVLPGMRADKWRHLTYLFDHLIPSVFFFRFFPSDFLLWLRVAELIVNSSEVFDTSVEEICLWQGKRPGSLADKSSGRDLSICYT